jgi:acylphosphatase
MHMKQNYRIVIQGNVQGVGFRFHTRKEAQKLGITGWVKNQPDGTVLIDAEGEIKNLGVFVAWCHKGPALARVHDVDVTEEPVKGYENFDVRY